jgi:NAD/NADP transhydrogenase beta subunit
MNRSAGLILIALGMLAVLVGVLTYSGWLSWFGRLPGDIRYESDNVHVYIPIVTMLILSVIVSLVFYLLRRFF